MSGHSKWATIKRQKGVNDAKRGQLFTRLGNAIAIAAKNGGDPAMNPTLAMAVEKARAANMPMSNIERSIKRGSGELGGQQIQQLVFEGYGPEGIAIIIETATDNRNRTSAEIRTALTKHGGNLAETGAVSFQFTRKGLIRVKAEPSDEALLAMLDAGAEDVVNGEGEMSVFTEAKLLGTVRDAIKAAGYEIIEAGLSYEPNNVIEIKDPSVLNKIENLMEAIEDQSDVTDVYSNFDVSDQAAGV